MPIVMFLTTSDLTRPIRIPASAGRGAERPTMDSTIRCPFVDSVAFLPCRNPRVGQRDHRRKANMNTLAQAEVRRNRLKNNTTRLSPAPGQAICNCWHKRKLAGYPTGSADSELEDTCARTPAVISAKRGAIVTPIRWCGLGPAYVTCQRAVSRGLSQSKVPGTRSMCGYRSAPA
jgi:hypothetical protein